MNGKELIILVKRDTGFDEQEIKEILDSITTNIGNCLVNEEDVKITNFGTFKIKSRAARTIVNVATGEEMIARGGNYIKFNPCRELKDAVK